MYFQARDGAADDRAPRPGTRGGAATGARDDGALAGRRDTRDCRDRCPLAIRSIRFPSALADHRKRHRYRGVSPVGALAVLRLRSIPFPNP